MHTGSGTNESAVLSQGSTGAKREIINFDKGWKFQRVSDSREAINPDFDDSKWRTLDVPHDWAIEGTLKPEEDGNYVPLVNVTAGEWLFSKGDDMSWKSTDFDDKNWQKVVLPAKWEDHSGYKEDNVYGWYRREIVIPASMKGRDVVISVGLIDDVDETFFNGEFVGGMGKFPPDFDSRFNRLREYTVRSSLIKYGEKNLIAVRVFDEYGPGGIYAQRLPPLIEGPFDRSAVAGSSNGFLPGGIGWYRKTFKLSDGFKGKNISIEFDGVYMDSEIWLNGKSLGVHPYGYTGFSFDLTPYLKYGKEENVIVVRVNVKQQCTRWYSGAGIYRHVRLVAANPVHIAKWGTYITTPVVSDDEAQVDIATTVKNTGITRGSFVIETVIYDKNGKECARERMSESCGKIFPNSNKIVHQKLKIRKPMMWSLEEPNLYRVRSTLTSNGARIDSYDSTFGVRTIAFTMDRGFFLNGRRVAIKGVCLHHDNGYLGAAVHRRAIERQIRILKAMGCNAIRTSHNPPDPSLLEFCDKMGMLVMDEIFDEWKEGKVNYDYGRFFDDWAKKDLTSMLHRDRNHPSIILWSIGNEIVEQWTGKPGDAGARAKMLGDICHAEDPTRPVTCGFNGPDQAWEKGMADATDVFGINYNITAYAKYRGRRALVATETCSATSSRGEYNLVLKDNKVHIEGPLNTHWTSYDNLAHQYAITPSSSLKALRDAPWVAGEFVWTGFDYIGETTPFDWPAVISYFGIVDICGFPKDRFYLYQSQWSDKPMVHLLPHWNWDKFKGMEIPVYVYSNCDSVELFLNGKSLGEKSMKDAPELRLEWAVPYKEGELNAIGKRSGKEICRDTVKTAGKPSKIELFADRDHISADGEDLSYITVKILDSNGIICPDADNKIKFSIKGKGKIAATGNGNQVNHAFFNARECKAFHGMCLVIIKASEEPDTIELFAESPGLKASVITIMTQ